MPLDPHKVFPFLVNYYVNCITKEIQYLLSDKEIRANAVERYVGKTYYCEGVVGMPTTEEYLCGIIDSINSRLLDSEHHDPDGKPYWVGELRLEFLKDDAAALSCTINLAIARPICIEGVIPGQMKSVQLIVHPHILVESLKGKLLREFDVHSPDDYRVEYMTRVLKDDDTLEECSLEDDSLVFLIHAELLQDPVQETPSEHLSSSQESKSYSNNECIICMDNPKELACVPCGHRCMCKQCSQQFLTSSSENPQCPVCRTTITQTLQIFET